MTDDRTKRPGWMTDDDRALASAARDQVRNLEITGDDYCPLADERDVVVREAHGEVTDVHELLALVEAETMDVDPKTRRVIEKVVEVLHKHQHSGELRSANRTLSLSGAKDLRDAAKLVRSFRRWLRAGVVTLALSTGTFAIWLYHWIGNRSVAVERARVANDRLDHVVRRQDAVIVALYRAGIFPVFVDGALSLPSSVIDPGDAP